MMAPGAHVEGVHDPEHADMELDYEKPQQQQGSARRAAGTGFDLLVRVVFAGKLGQTQLLLNKHNQLAR
jgi:hypothetical protein